MSKSSHGRFYTESTYIVLNAIFSKFGTPQYDIHYWLENKTKKVVYPLLFLSGTFVLSFITLGSSALSLNAVQHFSIDV
ncbi:hypothetical protein AHAS_Ahas01G0155100 [Arachis hypogaea]